MPRLASILSILAFLTIFSALAEAQVCTTSSGGGIIRAESNSDQTDDFLVDCVGGTPTGFMQPVPQVNITLTFNTPVTSRLLNGTTSEALLLVDEPDPMGQRACDQLVTGCAVLGDGSGTNTYLGSNANIFIGDQIGSNQIRFWGVPFDPALSGSRILRFTNLRVSGLAVGNGNPVQVSISITGGGGLSILNPSQTVATVQAGVNAVSQNVTTGSSGLASFELKATETYTGALKHRTDAMFIGEDASPTPFDQNIPGFLRGTESGFYNSALFAFFNTPLPPAGLADHGTRFVARFSGVSPLITLRAPLTVPLKFGTFNGAPPFPTADAVYGQAFSFATGAGNNGGIGASTLFIPRAATLDASGNMYVADSNNHRVLYYPAGSTAATRVYGQGGSFSSNTANNGGVTANSLDGPEGVAVDGNGNVYIADRNNNRVLFYLAGSTTATRVYGQGGSFTANTSNNGGISATSLFIPTGVSLDASGNLYIVDGGNNRVLFFLAGSTTATRVYGQLGSFTNGGAGAPSADRLNSPQGATVDINDNLYVADYFYNRVLFFPSGSTTATRVYGQANNFTTSNVNNGGLSANSLNAPFRVATDRLGNLYIADAGNNRILFFFDDGNTTADAVYGQGGNFTTGTANNGGISYTSLNTPQGLAVDAADNLYITDSNNSRVLKYDPPGSGIARLITTPSDASGAFAASGSTALPNNAGVVQAVYEVLVANSDASENLTIPFTVQYGVGAPNLPSLSGQYGLGAINATNTASDTAPIPRFNVLKPITIGPPNPPPVITTSSLPLAVVGRAYNFTMSVTSGTGPFTWNATGFPSGLSISTGGVITGIPTAAGTFPVSTTVTDSLSLQDTDPFNLLIVNPPVITTSALPSGTQGVAYNTTLAATSGTPGYSWSATGLPAGLSVTNAGVLSGTSTASGTFPVLLIVTDSLLVQTTRPLSLVISPPLQITTSTLPGGVLGQSYNTTVVATGQPPYEWQASGLPVGLSINNSGVLSGTPTAVGTFNVTLSVNFADNVSSLVSRAFTLVIAGSLQITTSSLPGAAVGADYSATVTATGGTPPYTFSATGLPANLGITNGGVIGGTPASAGSFTVNVTAADSQSQSTSRAYTLVVTAPVRIITTSLVNGTAGTSYSANIFVAGGTAPYTFQFVGPGAPPPGLSLGNNGAITGIPTAGTYAFSVRVTDSQGLQATQPYTVQFIAAPTFVTNGTLPSAAVGLTYQTTLQAQGGTGTYVYALLSSPPPGLDLLPSGILLGTPTSQGPFTFTASVRDLNGQSATRNFTILVQAAPLVTPTQLQLEFSGFLNGDKPPARSLALVESTLASPVRDASRSAGTSAPTYKLVVDSGTDNSPAPTWLNVSLVQGVVPGRLNVSTSPDGLSAGTYLGRIIVTTPDDPTQPAVNVSVSLVVKSQAPKIESFPALTTFASGATTSGRLTQTITLHNAGGGGSIPFRTTVVGNSRWITSVTPASGTTVRDAPIFARVEVDPTGLTPGQYRDIVRFTPSGITAGASIDVPVTLFVSGAGPIMDLSVKGLQFQTRANSVSSATRQINVINRGSAGTTVRWTATKEIGGSWLQLDATSGTATSTRPSALTFKLAPSAANLPAGTYYALVRISDPAALVSPQYETIVLQVLAVDVPPTLDLNPAGAVFVQPSGSTTPQVFVFPVGSTSPTPETLRASAATRNGGAWLSVTPTSTTVSSSQNAPLTVTVNSAGLAPGFYQGEIVVEQRQQVRAFSITLIVTNGVVTNDPVSSREATPGSDKDLTRSVTCTGTAMAITNTVLPNHFVLLAGFPSAIAVDIHDDCGRPVNSAAVIASFTNGDAPLSLLPTGDTGTYSATWQPLGGLTQTNITVRATEPTLTDASALLIGDVNPNAVPVLTPNGTVHNLNPQLGGSLSPGLVVQVYGKGLATEVGSTGTVPLPTTYKGTSLRVGEFDVPLYFVSPEQLVAQLPFEIGVNSQEMIVAIVNDQITTPYLLDISQVQPGVIVFQDGTNTLVAQHATPGLPLVTDQNPAHRGETLTMYLVGLGATSPAVATGAVTPSGPLSRAIIAPTVTIDGQPVQVGFAGLTPTAVGLYQINFTVPSNARTGVPLDVVVTQRVGDRDFPANATRLTVVP